MKTKFLYAAIVMMLGVLGVVGYFVYDAVSGRVNTNLIAEANEEEVSVDLSSYPIGVQNGTVSVEYYNDLYMMLTTYLKYADKMTRQGISQDSIKYESERYLVELTKLKLLPVTDADSNLDSLALDYKIQSKLVADYMLDYHSSGNVKDRNSANSAMRESVKAFDILNEMMIDYEVES